jgi:hypothetical protein
MFKREKLKTLASIDDKRTFAQRAPGFTTEVEGKMG